MKWFFKLLWPITWTGWNEPKDKNHRTVRGWPVIFTKNREDQFADKPDNQGNSKEDK